MWIQEKALKVRAVLKVRHEEAYDYDSKRGIFLRRLVSEEEVGNLVTDAGRAAIHTYIYGTTAQRISGGLSGTGFNYIALSDDASAPAAGDTSLTAELSGNGLDRVQGAVTLPTGATTTTTIYHVFTFTGASQTVQKTALFDDASSGKMAHELLFTQRSLNTSDTISLSFVITLA